MALSIATKQRLKEKINMCLADHGTKKILHELIDELSIANIATPIYDANGIQVVGNQRPLSEAYTTYWQAWVVPEAATASGYATQKDLDGVSAPYSMAGVISPQYPRNVGIAVVLDNGTISTITHRITGIDYDNQAITEDITQTVTGTVYGDRAFFRVSAIACTAITGTGAAGDTVDVGNGVKMGLIGDIGAGLLIKYLEDYVDIDPATATIDVDFNTIEFATAPNGVHSYFAFYQCILPPSLSLQQHGMIALA